MCFCRSDFDIYYYCGGWHIYLHNRFSLFCVCYYWLLLSLHCKPLYQEIPAKLLWLVCSNFKELLFVMFCTKDLKLANFVFRKKKPCARWKWLSSRETLRKPWKHLRFRFLLYWNIGMHISTYTHTTYEKWVLPCNPWGEPTFDTKGLWSLFAILDYHSMNLMHNEQIVSLKHKLLLNEEGKFC